MVGGGRGDHAELVVHELVGEGAPPFDLVERRGQDDGLVAEPAVDGAAGEVGDRVEPELDVFPVPQFPAMALSPRRMVPEGV